MPNFFRNTHTCIKIIWEVDKGLFPLMQLAKKPMRNLLDGYERLDA